MASKQQVIVQSSAESSSSSDSSSSSSRESSPERAPTPAPVPVPVPEPTPKPTAAKRKMKTSRPHSSSKRSKKESSTKTGRKNKAKAENHAAPSQPQAQPAPMVKVTAKDIMGADSDIEDQTGKKDELTSYLSRRVANGVSKQFNNKIEGSQFIDLKVYMCNEIEIVSPMNRWRHAIVTLKTKMDENSPAYRYLVKFLKEVKKNFKESVVTYVTTQNQ